MKWKDSGEKIDQEEDVPKEDYFDEEQFSPWSDQKNQKKVFKYGKTSLLFFLLIVGIIASLTALGVLLVGGNGGNTHQIELMKERIRQLEERLEKYEAIDEKVTRIWEQAKSFEKFKDRFDRSEASMSLRMDHLTMSLEKLQKQFSVDNNAFAPKTTGTDPADKPSQDTSEIIIQYHRVVSGDTVYSVSKKYHISMKELLQINQMTKDSLIVPGQKLIIRKKTVE